jgi:hypothetical protein
VREFGVAAAVEEGGGWVGGDLPAGWCNFDDFAVGIIEIEENGVGLAGVAARGDASMDGKARAARKGAGFEGADGLAERIVGGRLAVVAIEGVDEPVAETGERVEQTCWLKGPSPTFALLRVRAPLTILPRLAGRTFRLTSQSESAQMKE